MEQATSEVSEDFLLLFLNYILHTFRYDTKQHNKKSVYYSFNGCCKSTKGTGLL